VTVDRGTLEKARSLILDWYKKGLDAVDPRLAVQRAIRLESEGRLIVNGEELDLAPEARVVAIAFGKAASAMAAGLDQQLGDRLTTRIILTKDDHTTNSPSGWQVFEAAHPVPDQRGVDATQAILEAVTGLDVNDVVIVLVSGGGSALLEAPREPLGLADIQQVTSALLRAGAPIQDLNAVRSELSQVKGGGLRRGIGEARCVSLILSDVLGNDPRVIASGPTAPRHPDPQRALALLESYGVLDQVPDPVVSLLRQPVATFNPDSAVGDLYSVVGDNERFINAIAAAAEESGFRSDVVLRNAEGEARELARSFLEASHANTTSADVIIGGGEATVTVRGDGIGGRNTEFALSAAMSLADDPEANLVVASLASDGQDGSVNGAGAIVDSRTVRRAAKQGLDAGSALSRNDSGGFFEELGELVVPGPTGTNVNDVYIAIRLDALKNTASGSA
jgi:hydroxypyruvate reductase